MTSFEDGQTPTYQDYYSLGEKILQQLHLERLHVCELEENVLEAKENLARCETQVELQAVEAAGGEKGLGANQAARDRALDAAKAESESLNKAKRSLRIAERALVLYQPSLRRSEEYLSLIKATLYAMSGERR